MSSLDLFGVVSVVLVSYVTPCNTPHTYVSLRLEMDLHAYLSPEPFSSAKLPTP